MTQAGSNASRVVSLSALGRVRSPGQRLLTECRERLVDGLCDWLRGVSAAVSEELFVLADSTRERLRQTRYLDLRADIERDWQHLVEAFRRNVSSEIERRQDQAATGGETPQAPLEIPDFEGLQLVDDAELSERIVVREFSAQLAETCDEEMYTLNRRVAVLLGHDENQDAQDNPLGPPAICQALSDSCGSIGADAESRLILLRRLERHLHLSLPGIYGQINAYLIERNILPDLKRTYRRNLPAGGAAAGIAGSSAGDQAPGTPPLGEPAILEALQRLAVARAAQGPAGAIANSGAGFQAAPTSPPIAETPPAFDAATVNRLLLASLNEYQHGPARPDGVLVNHVKQVRDSEEAKQASGLEAVTMDIVAMLFDLIFDDARIPIGIKALISRLQIPVLKVAMLNPGFFGDRLHPTRRFLAGISGISTRWGSAVDESDPFYVKLSDLVERIQREFEEDVDIFGQAVDELEAFVDEREAEENDTALAAANVVIQHEIEADAWERAQQAVRSFLRSAPQPAAVAGFLEEHWIAVLQRIAVHGRKAEADWESAIGVMQDLAWSVTPKKLPDERLKLIDLLPHLLAALNKGLDRIDGDPAQRRAFFDALVKLHSAALKGESAGQLAEETPPAARQDEAPSAPEEEGDLLVMRSVDNGVQVEEVILVGAPPVWRDGDRDIFQQVNALRRGDWVEFIDEGQTSRERLNWISPQRGILLFSNHRSAKAISITPDALAKQIRDGKAAIVRDEAIFERALNGALESINAF